jgi:hypothetical protein
MLHADAAVPKKPILSCLGALPPCRCHLHFGDSIGTFAHGQFFQLPSSPTQADEAGLFVGAELLVGAGALAVLTGVATCWST